MEEYIDKKKAIKEINSWQRTAMMADGKPTLSAYVKAFPPSDVVEREKIDKAIRIAKDSISMCFKLGLNERAFGMREILEIFEENIEE